MNAQTNTQGSAAVGELQESMVSEAPTGWVRTVLEVSAAADTVAFVQRFELVDGAVKGRVDLADPDADVRLRRAIHGLRSAMHRPDVGTWYGATFSQTADGEGQVR